jgi:hypothetical protein
MAEPRMSARPPNIPPTIAPVLLVLLPLSPPLSPLTLAVLETTDSGGEFVVDVTVDRPGRDDDDDDDDGKDDDGRVEEVVDGLRGPVGVGK